MFNANSEIIPGIILADALSELANVGTGNASAKLEKEVRDKFSKNSQVPIQIYPQLIACCHLSNIETNFQKANYLTFYSILNIDGNTAILSVFFSVESALNISGALQAKKNQHEVLTEDDEKLLMEMANIIINSYTDSSATFLNLPIVHTQTKKAFLESSTISSFIKETIGEHSEVAVLLDTDFSIRGSDLRGNFKTVLSFMNVCSVVAAMKKKMLIELGMGPSESAVDKENKNNSGKHPFYLHLGGQIDSLCQLKKALESMPDEVFNHHVTSYKNDFAVWIHDSFLEDDLAAKISKVSTKKEIIDLLDKLGH